ncbi:carbon storage regulator [Paenibacillus sambharensis]|uniref:Translational regulator CsrA n=1 Tax=Paenibacillus sambharensis TaxID=1803190 RepID=A0A2W1LCD6_9BACL|nr:carbon storage regulator CsrA [Paenibacillus sambharensis]PZD97838.1 carbon storage regulator [Paenibacillus sambharensis]
MLVLTRKKGQSIVIGDDIEVVLLEVEGDTVKIGITAPKEVQIVRKELLASVTEVNQEAAASKINSEQFKKLIQKNKKSL